MRGFVTVLTQGAHSGLPNPGEYVTHRGNNEFATNVLRVTLFDTEGGADIHCRSAQELRQLFRGA